MAYHHSNGYSTEERDYERGGGGGGENYEGDKPTYLMEHLATFSVTKEAGIAHPVDGMRRLLQLEKTNGIWSQRMQLCLDRNMVLIMDYESKTVMERFPAECIKEPTAFTSHDPMEMYNNILVFTVTNLNPNQPPEMHIFQCQTISAQDLVEDLKQLQQGKLLTRSRKSSIPPPSSKSMTTQHIVNPTRSGGGGSGGGGGGGGGGPAGDPYRESDSEVTNNDDNSSTTSEQYERDVTILNHCFDDIEKFIARLQHAAAATRELERRRRSRKSKKRDNGDGMLSLRTKPPHEKEFYDIFQKFKLSFNLLAKLKAHIHDPNAPELVHFLFTPLALIVEAASDTYLHKHLPQKVVAPLLTREAHNLLTHCVTSKETELWHSLGNAWITPRDEWKGPVSSYHPVFLNNWSPEYPVVDELEYNPGGNNNKQQHYGGGAHGHGGDMYNSEYNSHQHHQHQGHHHMVYDPPGQDYLYERNNEATGPAAAHYHQGHDGDLEPHMHSGRSDISVDSIERNNGAGPAGASGPAMGGPGDERGFKRIQENFRDQLNKKNAMVVQVTYPRTANNDKELSVVRGEYLEILDDSRKWWKARNHKGEVAHVPHTIVSRVNYHNSPDIYNNPLYGDRDHNRQDSNQDMYGHGPSPSEDYHVAPPPPPPAAVSSAPADLVRKERLVVPPPPPPPPPLPPVAPPMPVAPLTPAPTLKRSNSLVSSTTARMRGDRMQDELNMVLQMFRDKRRHDIDVRVTPEVFINHKSNPDEVQEWLEAKEFHKEIRNAFGSFTGQQLFQLSRAQLEKICGQSEGSRLSSQLTIQKSVSQYQTFGASELKKILARVRQKIDTKLEDRYQNEFT